MDDTQKAILDELLKWMRGVGNTIESEAPKLAAEIIRWGYVHSILSAVGGAGLLWLATRIWNFVPNQDGDCVDDDFYIVGKGLALAAVTIAGFVFFVDGIHDLALVIVAPRAYLLGAIR